MIFRVKACDWIRRWGQFVWFWDKSWKYELMMALSMLNTPAPIQWHTNNTPSLVKIGHTFISYQDNQLLLWAQQKIMFNALIQSFLTVLEAWTDLSPARHGNVQVEGQGSLLARPGRAGDNIQMKIPRFCHINCNNNQIIHKIFDDNNNMFDCCYFNVYVFHKY